MADRPALRLIIYDIASDRRRRRVAATLEERAARVQESAFEARLTAAQFARLQRKLERLVTAADSLRFYTIPDAALERCHAYGGASPADGARYWLM